MAQLVQRFDSGKTKEDYKLQLRARCQRPTKNLEAFADNLTELVENASPEAAYSSLVKAIRVVRRLESTRKACQALPSVEKKKSLNVVSASADDDKI